MRIREEGTRATRIIATIGPACQNLEILRGMIRSGVDVFRLNMSQGDLRIHARSVSLIRSAASGFSRPIGIMCDLQGPKLRTGGNEGGEPFLLRRGEAVQLVIPPGRGSTRSGSGPGVRRPRPAGRLDELCRPGRIFINCPGLADDLEEGDSVLLTDGRIQLRLQEKRRGRLLARVIRGGMLREHAGVNLPGRVLSAHAPTRQDLAHALFALRQRVDFVALSFVQSAEDMGRLRRYLLRRLAGKKRGAALRMPLLVAKIEKPAALEHLEEILDETDGVLVARGDLGVELPYENVPLLQKMILGRARDHGCFTITATQMLESMIQSPTPTRAEVSDVANAIWDGTDALMLTAETAIGKYPAESLQVLTRVVGATEPRSPRAAERPVFSPYRRDGGEAMASAAVELAERSAARWIVVFTQSGRTARLLARHRPHVPILALTPHEETRRKLTLCWSTTPLFMPRVRSVEEMMRRGVLLVRRAGLARAGDPLVLVAGASNLPEATNLLRLVNLGKLG